MRGLMTADDQFAASAVYLRCIERVTELASSAQVSIPIPACPGWTLHNLCSHLAGNATALATGDINPNSPQEWIDEQIARRRSHDTSMVLTELADSGTKFARRIAREPRRWAGIVYDAIAHEHDIRGALGRPGARSDAGIELSLDFELRLLARHARELKLPAIAITSGESSWRTTAGPPAALLRLDDRWELFRVLGSRRSPMQVRSLEWSGDAHLLLASLHTPPPIEDLIEPLGPCT